MIGHARAGARFTTGGVHQLETGVDGVVERRRVAAGHGRRGPVADPGRRGAQAEHVGPAERLPGRSRGRDAERVHEIPVRATPVRAAAVRVPEQTGTAARQVAVLSVAVRPAHRQTVPGQRHRTVAAARRRRDVLRVRRVRGRHQRHRVQRTLGAHRQAVPAVRRQLRFYRQTRVPVPGLGLPAQARGRHGRRQVPEGTGLQHVHAARQVLHVAAPRHHTAVVRRFRVRLQTVQLRFAKHFGLRSRMMTARVSGQ